MNSTALEALLEVGIGMVFMWLILSIATMSIQEWIASYLKWRAKDLETATRRLLGNDSAWSAQLYAHPLIQGLTKKDGDKPSYIPANKFALALFDIVMTAGTPESYIQRQLHAAQAELDKAPDKLFPLIGFTLKRWWRSIIVFLTAFLNFVVGTELVTKEQKYAALLKLLSDIASDAELTEADLRNFITLFFETEKNKTLAQFLKDYPELQKILDKFLEKLEITPELKAVLDKYIQDMGSTKINELLEQINYEALLREIKKLVAKNNLQSADQPADETLVDKLLEKVGDAPFVDEIKKWVGQNKAKEANSEVNKMAKGLAAVQKSNPELYKVLNRMQNDLIGVANNTQIMDSVRTEFAKAAAGANEAELSLEAMRLGSETWFNESMERLGGWYKRRVTVLAFAIGLVFASAMNIDSITLAQHLWKEPAVRQALAAQATEFAKKYPELPPVEGKAPQDVATYFSNQFAGLNVPLGWVFEYKTLPSYYEENGQEKYATCEIFPIGKPHAVWGFKNPYAHIECQQIANFPTDTAGWGLKILGILISAAAAAQGAPFWFDILKKLVNIRGTGANPTETEQKNK